MVGVLFNAGTTSFKQNSYGDIQRLGTTTNNRTVYQVIDSQGEKSGKLSIPKEQAYKFEKAYKDVMITAPKIQEYVLENSSEKDIKRRRNLSRIIVGTGGLIGAIIPIVLTQKASKVKAIISTVAGIIIGLSAGYTASLLATMPPGTLKFAKATKTFSKLDIQPVIEDKDNPNN